MSNNDYGRELDTALAEAFRKVGVTSSPLDDPKSPPDDPKSDSRGRRLRLCASRTRRPSPINLRSGYSAELDLRRPSPINLWLGYSAKLDLHGCSEDQAYERLERFIEESARKGYRKVLVITGKGSGKLKRLVPFWLEAGPFKEFVDNVYVADSWNGGDGALYVHLCRC